MSSSETPITVEHFNDQDINWILWPRIRDKKEGDFAEFHHKFRLVNTQPDVADILLFSLKETPKQNYALTPSFLPLIIGEKLVVLGCEKKDIRCRQDAFQAEVVAFENGLVRLKPDLVFDITGFSGAPVLADSGNVVGLVVGGGDFEGEFILLMQPIIAVRQYLE